VDNETNSEGTSGKDGGKMKIGDKVWVLCEVVEGPYRGHIECKNGSVCFRPLVSEVKPVEPEAVEQPTSDPINPSHCKQNGIEDLKKARWYLDRLIKEEGE
jgi:hypothetical protein